MQHKAQARDVAPGTREASDEPASNWIRAGRNNDWDCFGNVNGSNDRVITTGRYNGINFKPNQLSSEVMVPLRFPVHKAPFNDNVLSFAVAELAESLPERFIVDPKPRT
jgi:hypothetical protein